MKKHLSGGGVEEAEVEEEDSGNGDDAVEKKSKKMGKKKVKKQSRVKEAITASSEGVPTGVDDLKLADEILTHFMDVTESCFGVSHVCVAKACCDVAFLAVIRQEDVDALDYLRKAFGIYREVESSGGSKGVGVGTASTSVSIGRLRLKDKEDEKEVRIGASI